MIEKILNEDAYVRTRMAQLPDVKKGNQRTIKKGDCLWNIAKEQLNKNAKKSEISDYMLIIAKLNGLDTTDKMNHLNINDKIYLPEETDKQVKSNDKNAKEREKVTTQPENNKIKVRTSAKTDKTQVTQPPKPQNTTQNKTSAEESFSDNLSLMLNEKTTRVRDARMRTLNGEKLYHVYYLKKGDKDVFPREKNIMSIGVDKNNKIRNFLFEGKDNVNNYGYDYVVKASELKIREHDYPHKAQGQISKSQLEAIQNFIDKAEIK